MRLLEFYKGISYIWLEVLPVGGLGPSAIARIVCLAMDKKMAIKQGLWSTYLTGVESVYGMQLHSFTIDLVAKSLMN